MRYILQAVAAIAALIALPLLVDAPETLTSQVAAGLIALILIGLAFRGVVGFVHSRKPKSFHDSVIVPKETPKK